MENESSTTQQKVVLSTPARNWILALPGRFWAKIITVMENIKKLGKDDPRRVIHSLKVGFALTLVSLLYYVRPLYDGFGVSGMWAVLTVVVVFEFSVGATLSKSLNRGFATLLAGTLGVGAEHLASLSGDKGKPILLGILVFLLGAASTFSRFYPKIKARYDYGVLIFILTFSLVAVSGYRVDELIQLAHQRLSTILIGGATCIVIAIFVCPVWAGEDLHKLVASNIEKLAAYLEGFGSQYFQVSEGEEGSKKDKSFPLGYKSVLTSKNTEDTLANFARWEPGHGRFRLRHPWKLYLKIGGLARQCAYQIEALNGYINSINIKVPPEFKVKIQESCTEMSVESSKALKALATSIKTMSDPSPANSHLEISKNAVNDIQSALQDASALNAINSIADLQAIVPAATVAAILMEIVKCVEKITESVNELSNVAHFKKKVEATVSPETGKHLLHRGTVNPVFDSTEGGSSDHVVITIHEISDDVVATAPDSGQPRPRVQV